MNKEDLLADLQIIFEKELFDLKTKETFEPKYGNNKYKHLDYLIKLYLEIEREPILHETFISYVFSKLHESPEYFQERIRIPYSECRLSFVFLICTGNVENAIRGLNERAKHNRTFYSVINFIPALYKYYEPSLNNVQWQTLKTLVGNHRQDVSVHFDIIRALGTIHEARIKIVSDKIENLNIEINSDKQKIIEKITLIGIDERINRFFNDLDDYILVGKPKDFAGGIATLRNAISEFIIDLASKISERTGELIPDYASIDRNMRKIGKARHFIKDKLNLTDNEHKFINDYISILQDEGGHSFASNKEYLRLSKNIAIELILFLLTKYEEKQLQSQ